MQLLLVVILLALIFGGLPTFGYHGFGYGPSGLLGLVLIVFVILALTGRV